MTRHVSERRVAFRESVKIGPWNRIAVVESLRTSDTATGYRLFENVLRPAIGDAATFHDPPDMAAFLRVLERLATECEADGVSPILQVETHGDDLNVEFGNGERLAWATLVNVLRRINIASKNNLMVVVAACCGINLGRVFAVDPLEEAPVRIVVGPQQTVYAPDIERSMTTFYETLLRTADGTLAVNRLVRDLPSTGVLVAERIFANGMTNYFEKHCTPEELEGRYLDALKESGNVDSPALRHRYAENIGSIDARFEKYKARFFMIDRYPENAARFEGVVLE